MKLASLKKDRDGRLIVVDKTLNQYREAPAELISLQQALENWNHWAPILDECYQLLSRQGGIPLDVNKLASPLPRAYQWLDGSAYLSHVERVRKARGADMPPSFLDDPLMYQGGSDYFLGPRDDILVGSEEWGIDFEAEVCVITDDVPMGISVDEATKHIKLVLLVNDVSLRNLIPAELAKGFGFLHGKPPSSFSPVAVTIDELGENWQDGKLHLPLISHLNDQPFGHPNAGTDMQFNFSRLISHAAKTRPLGTGTIIGSGTVSNQQPGVGYSCLAEKRVVEKVEQGEIKTAFMSYGDRIHIEMNDPDGQSIFGAIEQEVKPWTG